MARFTTTGGSGDGTPGAPGAPGADGISFLWSAEFDSGTTYPLNYVVSYQGSSYIKIASGGSFPLPTDSNYWNLLAQKGKDSFFLGTWNSVTEFLAVYQGGPIGLADGDWWAFVKDNTNPNKIYVVREDPISATGWVIDDNEHFLLPQGPQGEPGEQGVPGTGFGIFYLGNYNPSSGYVPNIAVVRGSDGQLYLAKASGQLGDPVGNTAQWEVWIPKGQDGAPGTNGADALWNYVGEYSGGASYAVGDVVTYDGQLWYRYNANGGNVGDTPSPGLWNLLAAKGADGSNGTSFTSRGAWTDSENYAINDIVTFEGSAYVCIVGVTAGTDVAPYPQNIGAYWNLLVSGSTADTGQITFLGVYIIGAGGGSGDGAGNGTIKLLPDEDLVQQQYHEDQYLIIDPTSPNHIHIRAGGVQDASTADLFLGAERTGVQVSDASRSVIIRSKNPDLVNTYGNSNGTSNAEFIHATGADIVVGDTVRLYTGGDIFTVTSVTESEGAMTVVAEGLTFITGEAYTFFRSMGEDRWMFQTNGITFPNNTVQTDAFVGGATGTFTSQDNKTVTVTNGIITGIV